MDDEIISIIIPVYNLEGYINKTLDCVFSQTYKNIEVIAVDDGSSDRTAVILDEYSKKENRLKVIHKQNQGVSAARNDALDIVTGEYIGFVDGDDLLDPCMFEFLLDAMKSNNADISHCGFKIVRTDGTERMFYNTDRVVVQNREQGLKDLLKGEFIEPTCCNKLYKSSLFEGIRFDTDILCNEDLLINFRLFKKAEKSVFNDKCLYYYMRREGSASRAKISEKLVYHPTRARETIIEESKELSEEIQRINKKNYIQALIGAYSLIVRNGTPEYKKSKNIFRKKLLENKDGVKLMSLSGKIHCYLIMYFPFLCPAVFGVYYRIKNSKQYG